MTEWESICKRCGLCCFEKWVEGDGTVHHTHIPCRYLDIVTRECKVYEKRLDVDEGCIQLTAEIVRSINWLPEGCAYLGHIAQIGSARRKPKGKK